MTTAEILSVNTLRMENLFSPYDPILGTGSYLPRFEYKFGTTEKSIFLPLHMKPLVESTLSYPSLEEYILSNNGFSHNDYLDLRLSILTHRIHEDFEYWCAMCGFITPKVPEGESAGGVIPFVLNRPQRRLAATYEHNRIHQIPNREVILKARQWGGSTVTDVHDIFTVLFHVMNWNISIVAHVEEAARNIRGMVTTLAKHHPKDIFDINLVPYEGSVKSKAIPDIDGKQFRSVISIGSMEKPDGMNSKDIKRGHFSESGLWKKTIGKDPFHMAANIEASIPFIPHSSVVYESTAHGSGNFFHRKFTDAQKGVSGFHAFFVPWHEIERYILPFDNEEEKIKLAETLSDRDMELWENGATLQGIKWHRHTRKDFDEIYMGQHFPSTPEEAFMTTGRRVFLPTYVKKNRTYCVPPKYVGDMFAEGRTDAIEFKTVTGGDFFVWFLPETDIRVSDRYIVQVDIGASSAGSSWSVIRVFDRIDLMNGGTEEAIATWRSHLDTDLVVWKAVQIAIFYNNAMLSFESNPIDARESEGDHSITLLDEIAGVYSNLFTRTDPEKIRQGHPLKYGIHTNVKSKTDYVNQYKKRLREGGYIEYDERVNNEADTYEYKENGRMKCIDGNNDDILECTMMGLKVSELMPVPMLISDTYNKQKAKAVNEATF